MRTNINFTSAIRRLHTVAMVATLLGGCNGPANPEPVMLNTGSIFLQDDQPGRVSLTGEPGAAENADGLIVQNLDLAAYVDGPVSADGAFDLVLDGMNTDRFRLIAFNDQGGFASLVVTTDGISPNVIPVDESGLGCLSVEPPYVDFGTGPAGEPLYTELTVRNDCPDPGVFVAQDTLSEYFTPVSLLLQAPLEVGSQATVSVVFLAPPGQYEAVLTLLPDPAFPGPEQLPLQVVLRAEALP